MSERPLGELIADMSPWRTDCASQCLAKFGFRYLEQIKHPHQSVAAAYGSALDEVGNSVYSEKLASENTKTASAEDVADRFASAWDYNAAVVDDWGDEKAGKLLDRGVKGAKLWREGIALWVDPISPPQKKLSKRVTDPLHGDEFNLFGYLDLHAHVRGRETIIDLKAPGKRYSESKMVTESQPTCYTIMTGVRRFEYHVVTNNNNPGLQVLGATIDDSQQRFYLTRVGMIRRQIKHAYMTGDWLPNRNHVLCKRRYCAHWRECEVRYGGKVAL